MVAIWAIECGSVYDVCFNRMLKFGHGDRLEPVWGNLHISGATLQNLQGAKKSVSPNPSFHFGSLCNVNSL